MRIRATTLSLVLALLGGSFDDAFAGAASALGAPLAGIAGSGLVQRAQMARPSPAPSQSGRGTAPQGPIGSGGGGEQGGWRPGGGGWSGEGSMAGYLPGRGPYVPPPGSGPGRRPGPLCRRTQCVSIGVILFGSHKGQRYCRHWVVTRFRCH